MNFENLKEMTFSNLDCEIYYWYKQGISNDYIILLHGAGCDHEMFEKQISIFDDNFNLIVWDARGHGLSRINGSRKFYFSDMYADCLKLFEIHKIKTAILIGQSMGGNLAQEVVYYNPELVSKLILIDCTKNTQKLTAFEKISLKTFRFIFNCYPWKMLISQSANACGVTEYTKNYVNKCFNRIKKEEFIEIMISLFTCLNEDNDFRFKQSVLLICGDNDISGNIKKTMKQWVKDDSNCKLCMIKNAGHNSNQDNPNEVNKNIVLFMNE